MAAPKDLVTEQRLRESYLKHAVRTQLHRRSSDDVPPTSIQHCTIALAGALLAFDVDLGDAGAWRGTYRRATDVLPDLVTEEPVRVAVPGSAVHRLHSAVHYFIALVENPARDPEPFMELLADRFSLHYTAEPLRSTDAMRGWVSGKLSSVVASEHDIHRITCQAGPDGRHTAEVAMKSQALFPDGSQAISRNTQHWTFSDDARERFPRIIEILIERDAVEFFGPAPDYAPRTLPA